MSGKNTISSKDYTSTIMRMAGNIAAGIVGNRTAEAEVSEESRRRIATTSVQIARAIVEKVVEEA